MDDAIILWKAPPTPPPADGADASDGEETAPSNQRLPEHAGHGGTSASKDQELPRYARTKHYKEMTEWLALFRSLNETVETNPVLPYTSKRLYANVIQTHLDATLKERGLRDVVQNKKDLVYVTKNILKHEIKRWIQRDMGNLNHYEDQVEIEESVYK